MSERYAKYDKLKFDYPADRVLRITFDRPWVTLIPWTRKPIPR